MSHLVNTAFKVLGFIKRESVNIKKASTLVLLYKTLVRSQLEYGTVIWNNEQKGMIKKVERVQRKFVKFYCFKFGIDYKSENYEDICKKINCLIIG